MDEKQHRDDLIRAEVLDEDLSKDSTNGIADCATSDVQEICWDAMERRLAILKQADLICRVGNALPALLFVAITATGPSASRPVKYARVAKELGCSLSTAKNWVADLEEQELVRRTSCGKSGVILEPMGDALRQSEDIRRVRDLVADLKQQVASVRQVLNTSLAVTIESLNKIAP